MRLTALQCRGLPKEHAAVWRRAAASFRGGDSRRRECCCCSSAATSRRRRVCCLASWERVTDASSGRDYYWNKSTGETSWEVPDSALDDPDTAHASNEELLELFLEYILTPAAKFDYPMPSADFMALVEQHRHAIYERQACFYDYVTLEIERTPPGGEPLRSTAAEARKAQTTGAAAIAMFDDNNMRWNDIVVLTRREAVESIRARLSNPELRDPL